MNYKIKYPLLALALVSVGTPAYAAKDKNNDALSINHAKISLVQAITTAEQHAHGKAARAEYEHTRRGWVYDVEVISGNKVLDVKVDADKGNIIASSEDTVDRDDDHDKED